MLQGRAQGDEVDDDLEAACALLCRYINLLMHFHFAGPTCLHQLDWPWLRQQQHDRAPRCTEGCGRFFVYFFICFIL